MASAYFCNTTSVEIAINLNNELTNHLLAPVEIKSTEIQFSSWPAKVSNFVAPGTLGTNLNPNVLVVFGSPLGNRPIFYEVRYDGGSTLDLYLFVLGDNVVGEDQTGDASRIRVKRIDEFQAQFLLQTLLLLHPA